MCTSVTSPHSSKSFRNTSSSTDHGIPPTKTVNGSADSALSPAVFAVSATPFSCLFSPFFLVFSVDGPTSSLWLASSSPFASASTSTCCFFLFFLGACSSSSLSCASTSCSSSAAACTGAFFFFFFRFVSSSASVWPSCSSFASSSGGAASGAAFFFFFFFNGGACCSAESGPVRSTSVCWPSGSGSAPAASSGATRRFLAIRIPRTRIALGRIGKSRSHCGRPSYCCDRTTTQAAA
mmetsp:Transcript_120999/g.342366  ORF Transcript_120999/g.342366 Transcript_120999/m.342366 type:complete len:237 (-) Transcript_120999:2-712(-)